MKSLFFKKNFPTSSVQPRITQSVQEVKHGLIRHGNILEALVVLAHRTALLLRVGQTLVDVGIGAMHLELAVAAVVIDKGLEHVVLEIIGDVAQTTVEHHATVHILVDDVVAEIAQTNLAHRDEGMQLIVPFHLQVRDDDGLGIEVGRPH